MEKQYGDQLKEARVEKGLSLEDVSDELKINLKTLKRMESSQTEELPKAPFTRGFLKTYSGYLSLEAKSIIDLYDSTLGEPQKDLRKGVLKDDDEGAAFFPLDFFKEKIFPVVLLGSSLLGAVLIYSFLKQTPFETSSDIVEPETIVKEVEEVKPSLPEVLEKDVEKIEDASKPVVVNHVKTVYEAEKIKEKTSKVKEAVKPLSFSNKLVVEPLAKTKLYIKTNLDEAPVRATLKPDKKRVFKFDSAEIRFVDAGAVNVVLNGKDLGALGGFGEEKKIEFPSLKEL